MSPLFTLALVGVAIATYASAIALPFVYDDLETIVNNPHIVTLWPVQAPLQSAVAGRPVVTLSLALNFLFGGRTPAGYHAWNLVVHILCGLVLFGIIRRTLERPSMAGDLRTAAAPIAFASTLLWLVHPIQTEVIDYVTQRTESMMGLFLLFTLYAALRSRAEPAQVAGRWRLASLLACAVGMATKESMVVAPVIVLLYDVAFESGSVREAWRRRGRFYGALASTWIILALLNWNGPRSHSAGFSSGATPWSYLLNQAPMIVTYLKLAFWPDTLVMDYGLPQPLTVSDVWPAAVVVLALAAATVIAWRVHPRLAFLATWFFALLAPTSSVIPIGTEVGAERRMYLPLAALVILVTLGVWWLIGRWRPNERTRRRLAIAALFVVCGVLMTLTVRRHREYRTELSIWQSVLDRHPHGRAHYNVGVALTHLGRRAEAMAHYTIAAADYPEAHYAIAFELSNGEDRDSALSHYREFIRLRPDDRDVPRAYHQIGRLLTALGRLDQAAAAFEEVVRMQPSSLDAHGGLADVRMQQQRYDDAIAEFRKYLALDSKNASAHYNLGIALVAVHREPEAISYFSRAVELQPNDVEGRENLALALAASGRLDEAIAQFRIVLAADPARISAREALNAALAAGGQSAR